ncbi:MAG: hypothetical protein WCE57_00470 [Salegentibacter sp.]
MIKALGLIMTIGGAIALIFGILGIFGSIALIINAWALAIIGFIFFFAGISLIKHRSDKDVPQQNQNT